MSESAQKYHNNRCLIIELKPQFQKHKHWEIRADEEAGATPQHNLIVANLIGFLHGNFKKECCFTKDKQKYDSDGICQCCLHVFPSDVYVAYEDEADGNKTKNYFPDVVIVKGKIELKGKLIENPFIIFEVLSKNQNNIIAAKIENFKQKKSLEKIITIDSTKKEVLIYRKKDDFNLASCEEFGNDDNKYIEIIDHELNEDVFDEPRNIRGIDDVFLNGLCMSLNDIYFKWERM